MLRERIADLVASSRTIGVEAAADDVLAAAGYCVALSVDCVASSGVVADCVASSGVAVAVAAADKL